MQNISPYRFAASTAATAATTTTTIQRLFDLSICFGQSRLGQTLCGSLSIEIARLLFVRTEQLNRWEATHAELAAQRFVVVRIHGAHFDDAAQGGCRLFVLGHQTLAVAAPRRIKLYQPHVIAVDDELIEIRRRQIDHVAAARIKIRIGEGGLCRDGNDDEN